ncbi:LysE family translocator [Algirhabdus cladophorae]|uniref:LysE family translocator n=1 Tax=Algirhabdus cladophorae TaxID=3377108 RepID=UPI003B845BEA
MSLIDLASYYTALIAIAVAPGPMLLLLMTRAASNDVTGAIGFSIGAALGSITIIALVCFGLSVWITEVPAVLDYSKYVMLAYILWIARDMWGKREALGSVEAPARSGLGLAIVAGFTTCITSPYMLVLFPLLLPEVMDITAIKMPGFFIISATTFLAEATAALMIVGLAAQLRRLTRSPRSVMMMNRSLAAILVVGGGWMAVA